jgi:3-phosphoshikimate 1-carboxyvinyltransferase
MKTMDFICTKSTLAGSVAVPGSKSHTIRAVTIAMLANGQSIITAPLVSADTLSAVSAATALGAVADLQEGKWLIRGVGPVPRPSRETIDVGNSGTTLNVMMGAAALMTPDHAVVFTGDKQIQRRPAGPLIQALNDLGASAVCHHHNGCPPLTVRGRMTGGVTSVEARSSQYVTSLLLSCPLADGDTELQVPLLFEQMYVRMTMDWLEWQDIRFSHDSMRRFRIPGGQCYRPFERRIPADFSTATFFFGAGALPGNDVTCHGLDMQDSQGDKAVVEYLRAMGAGVETAGGSVRIYGRPLHGIEIDMNDTPDALPMMAVVACFAQGTTVLRNVAQARIKETDRIAVMAGELRKMGADIEEREDGLVIRESKLCGAEVDGHDDHRVVMSLALAGMNCGGRTTVHTAEAAGVTFPEFATLMTGLGGQLTAAEAP